MSHWYCPNCKTPLRGNQVTYYEKCEDCGTDVEWIENEYEDININEALEKQIAKELNNKESIMNTLKTGSCPNCDGYLDNEYLYKYCYRCGQKIKW